ncbi:MAG TPA: hypothetical protein VG347_14800 [Verrucomicrobiae bacterium]|nr:hypothetical protein [Verrucomicrobiae bacterium]
MKSTSKCVWHMLAALAGYALGLVVLNSFDTEHRPHWLPHHYWLVLLPLLPLIYMANTFIRAIAELDEMKRKIYMEAMAFAGVATGFTCFSYLFLRDMGAPEFHGEWAFYMMWAYYGIGLFFSWRRYR